MYGGDSVLVVWIDTLGFPLEWGLCFTPTPSTASPGGVCHLAGGTQFNYRRQLRAVGAAVLGPEVFPPAAAVAEPLGPGGPLHRRRDRRSAGVVPRASDRGVSPHHRGHRGVRPRCGSQEPGVRTSPRHRRRRGRPRRGGGGDRRPGPVRAGASRLGAPGRPPSRKRQGRVGIFFPERPGITTIRYRTSSPDATGVMPRRSTWSGSGSRGSSIHLAAGTPIKVLEAASGVEANQLVRYARFVEAPDPERARRLLREAEGP